MAIKGNSLLFAAIGLVKSLGGGAEADEESCGGSQLDMLIETGERAYDEFLTDITSRRTEIGESILAFAKGVVEQLGVASRSEIEELKRAIDDMKPGNTEQTPGGD